MATANPYRAPAAAVADSSTEEFQEVRLFAVSGRIGRVRYIAYTIGYSLLAGIALGAISMALGAVGGAISAVGYILLTVLMIMLTIQRAHDFNTTGWLSILSIIPLVNLIFWFIPGTDGENDYGAKTPPNSVGVIVVACLVPIIFGVGILAAIALPAYQQYVQKAKAAQQFQKK